MQSIAVESHANLGAAETLSSTVRQLVRNSTSPATRRAYRSDLVDFLNWGGMVPSTPERLAEFIADRGSHLSVATIKRRIVGVGMAHTLSGYKNPANSDLIRVVLRGLENTRGKGNKRQALPILREDIFSILEMMVGISGVRDSALILLGFATAMRRSELVSLHVSDLQFRQEGLLVRLRRSKTDQAGVGRDIAIPYGRTNACPVNSVKCWLDVAGIQDGPVFRSIRKGGRVSKAALSDQSVASIVRKYANMVGLPAGQYSGHSLRVGFVTSAAKAGVSVFKIQQQTGHRSAEMVSRYVRDAKIFEGNAAGVLL